MSYLIPSHQNKKNLNSNKICKYYKIGQCKKGKYCQFKHILSKSEKWIKNQDEECIMYNNGFCKDGPLCKYIHNHKDKLENININENDEENYPLLPIWVLQHYYGKSIDDIYEEFVNNNLSKVIGLICKYSIDDEYIIKKIISLIESDLEIKYFLIRGDKEEIKYSLNSNFVNIGGDLNNIEIINENIVIIVFIINDETDNLIGFAKIENINQKNEDNECEIEWLWIQEIEKYEIERLKNAKDNYNQLINCANGCEIDKDLGDYIIKCIAKQIPLKKYNKSSHQKNNNHNKKKNQVNSIQINNLHVNINNNTVNNYNSIHYFDTENKKRKRNDKSN